MADIGLVGLGVMGANLSLNMAEKGYKVAVYNRTAAKTDAFIANAGSLAGNLTPCKSLTELAEAVRPPRPIVIMVKAGEAVDEQAEILAEHLTRGDILIDAGNANFRDTRRRVATYAERGIDFLGVGVSGGEEGARHGPSVMAGGKREAWDRVAEIFTAISAKFNGEPCAALVGPEGAGHFVKTIHNGIEYADMQMIAEVYGIMRDGLGMTPAGDGGGVRPLERGAAAVLPDRDLGEGARGHRPARPASRWSTSSSTAPARRAPAAGRRWRRRTSACRRR